MSSFSPPSTDLTVLGPHITATLRDGDEETGIFDADQRSGAQVVTFEYRKGPLPIQIERVLGVGLPKKLFSVGFLLVLTLQIA